MFPILPRFECPASLVWALVGVSAPLKLTVPWLCWLASNHAVVTALSLFLNSHWVTQHPASDGLHRARTQQHHEDGKANLGISQQMWGGDNPF